LSLKAFAHSLVCGSSRERIDYCSGVRRII